MSGSLKLNIGCGIHKLSGFINIDCDEAVKPDLVHKLPARLPYENDSCELIVMYHTIEHIPKRSHPFILIEIWRLISKEGMVVISYPNFLRCVENWKTNYKGMRQLWEATIFGRQFTLDDYHVSLMDDEEFSRTLIDCGFQIIKITPEVKEPYNTIIKVKKHSMNSYELDVQDAVWGVG